MPDYKNGKIYVIRCTDSDDEYIGSTVQSLSVRMAGHRRDYKSKPNACASSILIGRGTAYIELVEDFPCDNVEQLRKREGEIIRSRNCVNKRVAGRSKDEYYQENRDILLEKVKQYYQENKEEKSTYNKEYAKQNKDKIRVQRKEYRLKNKEAIAKKQKEKQQKQDKETVNAKAREYYKRRKERKEALASGCD